MSLDKNIKDVITKLQKERLSFAVITGKYEREGTLYEQKRNNIHPDLDLVFFDISKDQLHEKLLNCGLEHVNHNTYRYIGENGSLLPIDIYIEFINTGYYYIFKIDVKNLKISEGYNTISENDYIVYQILEPLIKFSGYKKRHIYRIKQYMKDGYITTDIKQYLCSIIGCFFTNKLLESIKQGKTISGTTIKMIKVMLMFKHGNFFRMIKQRVLKDESI